MQVEYKNHFKRISKGVNLDNYRIDARFISMLRSREDREATYNGYTIDIVDWSEKAVKVNINTPKKIIANCWVPRRYLYKKVEKRKRNGNSFNKVI